MIVKPTVAELLNKVNDNRYALVIMTAKRARQIAGVTESTTGAKDTSPVTIAAEEIADGKVTKI